MKINRIIKNIGIFLCLGIFAGCSNFDEINTNPDTITKSSAAMQCTGVVLSNLAFQSEAKAYLQPNALAKYIGYVNELQMEYQYNLLSNDFFDNMTILPNIDVMVNYATGTPTEGSYRGLAKFSRAYMFYKLTMELGDIPYSEANQGLSNNYAPKYDAQKDVLIGILDELKEADAYFANGVSFEGDPTPYAGNPDSWRRAGNAFALRILMSLSAKDSEDASLNIKQRFADIVNGGFLLTASTGFLGLNYTSVNKHPLWSTNDLFTSRTIISSLLIDTLKQLNDRRLFYFAEPAKQMLDAGKTQSDFAAYVGPDVSRPYVDLTNEFLQGMYSALNLRYLQNPTCEPRMMVTYAEQELILAEACIRGWITGNAEDYYKAGVQAALTAQMNTDPSYAHGMAITQAYIDNYFTGEAAFKTTAADQLKQIWIQRYILNFMQDSEESYFEYRRNKFPEFPIDPNTNLNLNDPNAIPMRWLYPSSETNYNRQNLIDALNSQYDGYDEVNKLMWLLK